MFNIYVDSEFRERGEITINVHLEIASLFFFIIASSQRKYILMDNITISSTLGFGLSTRNYIEDVRWFNSL